MKNKKLGYIIFASLIAIVSSIGLVKYTNIAGAQAPIPVLSGYAYSANFGSISFNCKNLGVCGSSSYKVIVNSQGYLTGFAWANPQDSVAGTNNIGWLQFSNSLSGFPSTGGTATPARIIGTPGNQTIVGWARFCSPSFPSLSCSSPSANAGGWDGWVSFDGPGRNVSIAGTSVPPGSGVFPLSGFAWGANFVDSNGNGVADTGSNELVGPGWIDMSGVKYEADETQPQVPALYLSATLASTTNTTDLTYSTDPGVNFTSCAGGMAVDNITGTPQSAPGWTGTLLTLAGTKISRTVTGIDIPFEETHFRVDCYDTNGGLHADAIVVGIPDIDEDAPQIDLCMMDFSVPTPAQATNCGTGQPVSMYYEYNAPQARLIWKATPGASLSNCYGLLGAAGWTNQTLATPSASYNGPQNKALGSGITTVYQMQCTDNLTGLPVTSNTATAILAPEETDPPTLELKGNKTGIDPYQFARTPATAIALPQAGGDIYLKWATTEIYSQCTVSANWPLPTTRFPNGQEGPIHVTVPTTFRIDCPTGTSGSTAGRPLTDYVYVSVGGIVVNPPSGPKKPVFIEF